MAETKKVLILGGQGFVGEEVVKVLRANGFAVTTPTRAELELPRDAARLRELLPAHDAIVYLLPPNIQGMYTFIGALGTTSPKHVVYASSALLYASSKTPQDEEATLGASSEYEQLKLAEELLLRYARGGHTLTVARLGNVYGSPKNKGVVGRAFGAMYGGKPLEVAGEKQLRDFIYRGDVAEAMAHIVGSGVSGVVNITTGVGTPIDTLLRLIEKAAGRGIPWVRGCAGATKDSVGDNRKLVSSGFVPAVRLEEGLEKTAQLYARSIS